MATGATSSKWMPALAGWLLLAGRAVLPAPAAAETLVVGPDDLQGWTVTVFGQGEARFVIGPGSPPIGEGSLRLAGGPSAPDDGAFASTDRHAGTPLAQLTALDFSLNVAAHPDNANYAGIFGIEVSYDSARIRDETIYFEPAYNGYLRELDLWQTWDVLNADALWSFEQGPPPDGFFTVDDFLALHPQATVLSLFYVVGGWVPSSENSVAYLDRVVFAASGPAVVYDFDQVVEIFRDGFESGDTSMWSSGR